MKTLSLKPIKRNFLKKLENCDWPSLSVYFDELVKRELGSLSALKIWLKDKSEIESYLEENFAWRYIRMSTNTESAIYRDDFHYFATEIEPKLAPFSDLLNKKLIGSPFSIQLDKRPYAIFLRRTRQEIELYREQNIPIHTQLQLEQQQFAVITGSMSIEFNGQEYTLEQASNFLKNTDRSKRESAFAKIADRRLKDKDALDTLFSGLVSLRTEVAVNTGFENFRDFSFSALGRFDYTVDDIIRFHYAIEKEIVPILKRLADYRKIKMGLEVLKPWDTEVDPAGLEALNPFSGGKDLIEKSITVFDKLDPWFGECLRTMKEGNLFDVESRMGKAPGGYNYPLAETGAPFIFMNAADSFRDVTTMVHEGGHAVQTFLDRDLELNDFKQLPSEVAELASMSMELISMKYWDIFFADPDDLRRAKKEQLIDSLKTLPWVATIDCFQNWIYTHHNHTAEERCQAWVEIYDRFGGGFVDFTGFEIYKANLWQKQLHLFEVPFYYIEYAISGLGAIAVWKNFMENPEKTLGQYKAGLSLGYTCSIKDVYETAGIKFDFSQEYIKELASFVQFELDKLL